MPKLTQSNKSADVQKKQVRQEKSFKVFKLHCKTLAFLTLKKHFFDYERELSALVYALVVGGYHAMHRGGLFSVNLSAITNAQLSLCFFASLFSVFVSGVRWQVAEPESES